MQNGNYLARQPVLDIKLRTWGYELLFRAGIENSFLSKENNYDGDTATMSIINDALLDSINDLSQGAKSLINFTRALLLEDYAQLLDKENVIIEILEDVIPDKRVVESCVRLKKMGYTIALDDFFFREEYRELLELVDIVKLDFVAADQQERESIVDKIKPYNVVMLAEKVESYQDFVHAKNMGCELFQGYFFSKPIMVKRDRIQESKFAKLRLISEVNSSSFDITKIEAIIKSDPVLTLRLLKYMNSSYFSFRSEVTSIQKAIIMLGPKRLKRWTTVVAAADLSKGLPLELLKESLFRAKFCELVGESVENNDLVEEFFMVGLLSCVDAFFGMPKEDLLRDLPLSVRVKSILLGSDDQSLLYHSLEIARALEFGMWDYVDNISKSENIGSTLIKNAYIDAVNQSNEYIALIPISS